MASTKSISAGETRAGDRKATQVGSAELWWAAFAAMLIPVGLIWDFSWENTIGIDRFWSPPHLAVNIGVWLSGILGLKFLFGYSRARHRGREVAGVNIGPLCAPSGAWILLWGAVAMQAALPFDNWWQQSYGLGAGLWHPPQILKTVGFITILFGGIALCAASRSANAPQSRTASRLFIWHCGLLLTMCALILTMQNYPNWQHGAWFYKVSCAIYPAVLLIASRASQTHWAATRAALVYTLVFCAMVWLLPLFPARPLTAPIHNPTDRMMPPTFPLLLVLPAFVMDWLRSAAFMPLQRPHLRVMRNKFRAPAIALILGTAFAAVFVPTQWFFAKFLLSPAADNWFFAGGGRHWPFFLKIDQARVMFWDVTQDPLTWQAVMLAALLAIASS